MTPLKAAAVIGNGLNCAGEGLLLGAIIPAPMHRIPSELRSYACLGESSTRMGDLLGSPRVAPTFRFFFFCAFGDARSLCSTSTVRSKRGPPSASFYIFVRKATTSERGGTRQIHTPGTGQQAGSYPFNFARPA